jgi:hypothetical protein
VVGTRASFMASVSSATRFSIFRTILHGATLRFEIMGDPDAVLPLFLALMQMATDCELKIFLAPVTDERRDA